VIILLAAIMIGSSALNSHSSAVSLTPPPSVTKINHIVMIIQENHSFDNMFGTFPGLPSGYGLNLNVCLPSGSSKPCVKPWNADGNSIVQEHDLPHGYTAAAHDFDGGKMDGFASAAKNNYPMSYYTGKTLPTYWNYAQKYAFDDYFFSSAISMSLPNHLYAVAAWDGCNTTSCHNFNGPTSYNLTFPQIAEYLTPLGITWGYYQYGWKDSADCTGPYTSQFVNSHLAQGDSYWTGLTDFTQVQETAVECSSLGNYNDLMTSIQKGTLPNVAWVVPESSVSDHPAQSTLAAGQSYVASIVNAIGNNKALWASTVIFITEDDWGGYYDGVKPLQIDSQGEGFREPLIAISPYAIPGAILHSGTYTISSGSLKGTQTDQEDFSAFLSTIEYNWNLPHYFPGKVPLTERDKDQPNLFFMLNFNQKPLQPLIQPVYSSSIYPYQTCINQGVCSLGASNQTGPVQLFSPPPYTWTETYQQALNMSGNGDGDD
jgi:phospholipase C